MFTRMYPAAYFDDDLELEVGTEFFDYENLCVCRIQKILPPKEKDNPFKKGYYCEECQEYHKIKEGETAVEVTVHPVFTSHQTIEA
jgi:hypothetical protein